MTEDRIHNLKITSKKSDPIITQRKTAGGGGDEYSLRNLYDSSNWKYPVCVSLKFQKGIKGRAERIFEERSFDISSLYFQEMA